MAISTDKDTDLATLDPVLKSIRTGIKGEFFVKQQGTLYLPPPGDIASDEQTSKYTRYKASAEFWSYTGQTQMSMVGRMGLDKIGGELPPKLDYLYMDADGNGLSLSGSMEQSAKNILAVKWHIAVVDYQGLTETNSVSAADVEQSNSRAAIKLYTRESVVKYNFTIVNGVKQLSMIMLCQKEETIDPMTLIKSDSESYLVLALDEDGDYYQQKIIKGEKGNQEGEREYIRINSQSVKFIPLVILSDMEVECELPEALGFLYPISQTCYKSYNVSADYKYYLGRLAPTININAMSEHDQEVFEVVNGRNHYEIGGVNMFPSAESVVDIQAIQGSTESYEKYFSDTKEYLLSIGADVNDNSSAKTATEAGINYTKQNSVLVPLVDNLENGYKTLISYCAMFEGEVAMDSVMDYEVDLSLSRDFDTPILNPQELTALSDAVMNGIMTKRNAVNRSIELGWQKGDLDEIMQQLENQVII